MLAVNSLIQDAYESINMVGLGEAAGEYGDGNLPTVAVKELNRLITQLNQQGFISMAQKSIDVPCTKTVYFKQLVSGEAPSRDVVDMPPPDRIESVARKVGDRFIILNNSNSVQMSTRNPYTTAMSWTYNVVSEPVPGGDGAERVVGVLSLDGDPRNSLRVWYNSRLPKYDLDDTIYLSDLYNELLMSGLCNRLANYFELGDEKKASTARDFLAAKTLIKRNNLTQRMLVENKVMGDYRDNYFNGLNGTGWC